MMRKLCVPTFSKHATFGYNCVTLNIITSIYKVKFQPWSLKICPFVLSKS